MRKNILLCLLIASSFLQAIAGGFQANVQGIKQNGMAQTGVGTSLDAASLFLNPGAMGFLKHRLNFNVGVNAVMGGIGYQSPDGFYTANNKTAIGTPLLLYFSYRVKENSKWTVGLGVNNPYGSGVEYEDDWAGQFIIRKIELRTFNVQPTVNYKINDKFGIGAGFNFYYGDLLLRRGIPVADTAAEYGEAELTGSGIGFGANIGLFYKINDKFSVGATFRTPIKMKVEDGDAEFDVPAGISDSFPKTTFDSELILPMVANIGLGYHVTEKCLLAFDINYTGWQSYDTLRFDYAFNSEQLEDTELPKNYKGSFTFRLGAQYDIVEKFTARAGVYFDMTPVKDGYLSPEGPDANRFGASFGLTYQPTPKVGIDASFIYVHSLERTGGSDEAGFYGSYKIAVLIPSIGIHLAFK
ncbi:MAG: outer membrane protein transport protein [Chitinophagales bacterium]|nr:outer membrane protein transport protein [Chitinophagales bacterium]